MTSLEPLRLEAGSGQRDRRLPGTRLCILRVRTEGRAYLNLVVITTRDEQRLRGVEVNTTDRPVVLVKLVDHGAHTVVVQLENPAVQTGQNPWALRVKGQACRAGGALGLECQDGSRDQPEKALKSVQGPLSGPHQRCCILAHAFVSSVRRQPSALPAPGAVSTRQ